MPHRWRITPHDPSRIAQLERAAGVPAVVAQLLLSRGICEPTGIRAFLEPKLTGLRDPDELPGVPAAADRILEAVSEQRKIVIYGDYDADGMSAAAILHRCLSLLGADIRYYVPSRLDEGYGLNDEALRKIASWGAQQVITVDCGIASVAEAQTARQLGLELIITDHHTLAAELPEAAAIVHPRLPGHEYPFDGLCGAGVAFKLAWALCQRASQAKRVSEPMREFLLQAVGLAALGTVADVVPLLDENRILVAHGLLSLRNRAPAGLAALMAVAKLNERPVLASEDVAFSLAPRLNAAGRLGQAQLGVELLTTDCAQRATMLAEYIHELNNSRTSLERSVYLAAHKQAKEQFNLEEDPALVLAGHDWHAGVIGIVAGKLADKYHRPVVLISLDRLGVRPGTGSARSVPGFNLHEAFAACADCLVGFGGHAAAAGLRIDEQQVEAFRARFCEFAAERIASGFAAAELRIDAETPLAALTMQAVDQMERLAPFGNGNERPLLCTSGVELAEPPKRIGDNGNHVAIRFRQHDVSLRGVAFGNGDWAEELGGATGPLSIAYRPVINHFRGRRSVELHLADWKSGP